MKKIFTLLLASGISASMFSQEVAPGNIEPGPSLPNTIGKAHTSKHAQNVANSSDRAAQKLWLSYADAADIISGGNSVVNRNYLFADTLPYALFGADWERPWIHSIGNVFDASSYAFEGAGIVTTQWPKSLAYTVDSLSITHLYRRTNPNLAVIDTLIATIYSNVNNVGSYYFSPPYAANFPGGATATDSLWYKQQYYDHTKGQTAGSLALAPLSGAKTVKYPLTIADTADYFWGSTTFAIPGGFAVAGNTVAITTWTYKPGVTYTTADTLGGSRVNVFNFMSYEEKGTSTYPTYNPCTSPFKDCDWNMSSIIRNTERYGYVIGTNPDFTKRYVPSYAFTQPYSLEQHVISYHVTSSTVGINDKNALSNGITLGQNQPNPFNGNTVISYEISTANNVSLDIFDIAGKKIVSLSQGKQTAGAHTIEVSSQNLPQGVYFYTLNVGNDRVTKKMTVVE